MRKFTLLLLVLFTLLSAQSWANTDLAPFINFLRSSPAFMNGTVAFAKDSVLYEEGRSIVKILKNQRIEYTFKENYLQVRPLNAFHIRYAGFKVKVISVTWTPKGIDTISEVAADFTGLSRRRVSREVAKVIEDIFGKQLHDANRLLLKIRSQNTLGQIFDIAKAVVHVFTKSDATDGVSLPNYWGELGLNFLPPDAKAFNLYGMRVGIKERDHFRASFKFTGDNDGIYPYSASIASRQGTDINHGKQFKIMARLVLSEVHLDTQGIRLSLNLGATEVISGILSGIEELARRRGEGGGCERCQETATFPAIRIKVEKQVRQAIMAQVDELWPYLPGFNINRNVLSAFKRHEQCRVNNLSCLSRCDAAANNKNDILQCRSNCDSSLNACLKN